MVTFQEIIKKSNREPLFIFITSTKCTTSSHAQNHVNAFKEEHPESDVYYLTVQTESALATHIAEYLRIKRNCPQFLGIFRGHAFLVLNGEDIDSAAMQLLTP
jgi:bacillithiol system protein YtxJ